MERGIEGFIEALTAIPGEPTDEQVLQIVENHPIASEALEPYVQWRPDRYTRNLIYQDDRYQVIALCWNVGQGTPVHDHCGQRCWMLIERGRLEISDFRWQPNGSKPELVHSAVVGDKGNDRYADVEVCGRVHTIANRATWAEPAVSVHIYSKPFDSCYIYDLVSGERRLIELSFDTVGELTQASQTG